jgi:hypothetical protein
MFVVWGLLLPLSAFIARFMKMKKWWFNLHRLINVISLLLVVVAFILAVIFSTTHFNTAHKAIGIFDLSIRMC